MGAKEAEKELTVLRWGNFWRLVFWIASGLVFFGTFGTFYQIKGSDVPIWGDIADSASPSFWDVVGKLMESEPAGAWLLIGLLIGAVLCLLIASFIRRKPSGVMGLIGAGLVILLQQGMSFDATDGLFGGLVDATTDPGGGYEAMQLGAVIAIVAGVIRLLPTQQLWEDISVVGSRARKELQGAVKGTDAASTEPQNQRGGHQAADVGFDSPPEQGTFRPSVSAADAHTELLDLIEFASDRVQEGKRYASQAGEEKFYKWCAKSERKLSNIHSKVEEGQLPAPPAKLETAVRKNVLQPLRNRLD